MFASKESDLKAANCESAFSWDLKCWLNASVLWHSMFLWFSQQGTSTRTWVDLASDLIRESVWQINGLYLFAVQHGCRLLTLLRHIEAMFGLLLGLARLPHHADSCCLSAHFSYHWILVSFHSAAIASFTCWFSLRSATIAPWTFITHWLQ